MECSKNFLNFTLSEEERNFLKVDPKTNWLFSYFKIHNFLLCLSTENKITDKTYDEIMSSLNSIVKKLGDRLSREEWEEIKKLEWYVE